MVVRQSPVLDAAVRMDERVRRARVAVERQADRPGVDELDPAERRDPAEREVGVAEDEPRLADAVEQVRLVVRGPGENDRTSEIGDACT